MVGLLRKSLLLGTALICSASALAGTFTAEVDKTIGTVDDQFTYTLVVEGSAGEPKIPHVDGLEFQAAGTSSSTSWINGKFSKQVQYSFVVTATKPGVFTIPGVRLKVDDEEQTTSPIRLRVGAAEAGAPDAGKEAPAFFVERELTAQEVYVGEQVISRIRIYHREPLYEAVTDKQTLAAFKRIPVEGEKTYNKNVNGRNYRVIEIAEVLVPIQAGTLKLEPYVLKAKVPAGGGATRRRSRSIFEDFFSEGMRQTVQKTARSAGATLVVKPLPKINVPAGFKNIVGGFEATASLSANQLNTGDTATLTVTVSGRGVLDGLTDLQLNLDPKIKVYADKPLDERSVTAEEGVYSKKTFKFAMVPTQPGKYELGEVKIPAFTPELGNYVEVSASLGSIEATGEAENAPAVAAGEAKPAVQAKVKILGEGLLGLHRGPGLAKQQAFTSVDFLVLGLLGGGPLVGLLLSYFFVALRKARARTGKKQKGHAYREFKKRFAALQPATGGDGKDGKILMAMEAAFKAYLGAKVGDRGTTRTGKELAAMFKQRGLAAEILGKLDVVFSDLAKYEYGDRKPQAATVAALAQRLADLAKDIEKVF